MGQWGRPARFQRGDVTISVIAHVDTGSPLEPLTLRGTVDDFVLTHLVGDRDKVAVDEMLEELRRRFVGRPYGEFCEAINVPVPL